MGKVGNMGSRIDGRMVDLVLRQEVEHRRNRAAERIYCCLWDDLDRWSKMRVWLGIWDWWKISFWVVVVVMGVGFWVWMILETVGWIKRWL